MYSATYALIAVIETHFMSIVYLFFFI